MGPDGHLHHPQSERRGQYVVDVGVDAADCLVCTSGPGGGRGIQPSVMTRSCACCGTRLLRLSSASRWPSHSQQQRATRLGTSNAQRSVPWPMWCKAWWQVRRGVRTEAAVAIVRQTTKHRSVARQHHDDEHTVASPGIQNSLQDRATGHYSYSRRLLPSPSHASQPSQTGRRTPHRCAPPLAGTWRGYRRSRGRWQIAASGSTSRMMQTPLGSQHSTPAAKKKTST